MTALYVAKKTAVAHLANRKPEQALSELPELLPAAMPEFPQTLLSKPLQLRQSCLHICHQKRYSRFPLAAPMALIGSFDLLDSRNGSQTT